MLVLQKAATESLWGISDLSSIMVYPTYGGEMGGMVMIGGSQQEQQDAVLLTPSKISEIEALPGVEQVIIKDYLKCRNGNQIR